jgi:hypothetical protein
MESALPPGGTRDGDADLAPALPRTETGSRTSAALPLGSLRIIRQSISSTRGTLRPVGSAEVLDSVRLSLPRAYDRWSERTCRATPSGMGDEAGQVAALGGGRRVRGGRTRARAAARSVRLPARSRSLNRPRPRHRCRIHRGGPVGLVSAPGQPGRGADGGHRLRVGRRGRRQTSSRPSFGRSASCSATCSLPPRSTCCSRSRPGAFGRPSNASWWESPHLCDTR